MPSASKKPLKPAKKTAKPAAKKANPANVRTPAKAALKGKPAKKAPVTKAPAGKARAAKAPPKKASSVKKAAKPPVKKPVAKKAPPAKPAAPVKAPAKAPVKAAPVAKAPPEVVVPAKAAPVPPKPPVVKAPPPPPEPPKPKKSPFQPKELATIKVNLEQQRVMLESEMKDLNIGPFDSQQSEMAGEPSFDEEYSDAAAFTFERERDRSLGNNIQDLMDRIDSAMQKIDKGTYGICERCGQAIDRERMKALPYSVLCIKCKKTEERLG